jgi:hypothetical protein
VQVKLELGTGPFDVDGSNVQFAVSTRVSQRPNSPSAEVWSWNRRIVAAANVTSVMSSLANSYSGSPAPPGPASAARLSGT